MSGAASTIPRMNYHTKYNRSEKGRARYQAYEKTTAAFLRQRKYRLRKRREEVVKRLEVLHGTQQSTEEATRHQTCGAQAPEQAR